MRTTTIPVTIAFGALLLVGCGDKDDDTGSTEADTDTDTDSDTDAATDSDVTPAVDRLSISINADVYTIDSSSCSADGVFAATGSNP